MNDLPDHDPALESLLQAARLRPPSDCLDARIGSMFAAADLRRHNRMRLFPLAVAAGLLVAAAPMVWFMSATYTRRAVEQSAAMRHPTVQVSSDSPVRIERDESRVFDDGVVAVSDNTPFREVRRQTVRDIWYLDPQTHARVLVRVPVEQVYLEKVEAY